MKFSVLAQDVNGQDVYIQLDDEHILFQSIDLADLASRTKTAQNDLRFPATTLKLGATSKPDFDYTNVGLLFPQNDETEIIYIVAQMPHSWEAGTTIYPHVHTRVTQAGQPVFVMEYKWYNNNATVPTTFTEYRMTTNTATWTTGTVSNIINGSGGISGTGFTESSILVIKLYRETGDGYTGDVLFDEFDIHYNVAKFGKDI